MDSTKRKIIHIDMDAFFASVEIQDNPELVNLPVIVGGNPEGRGVVATSNYIARKCGVFSAMPSFKAKQLCPEAVFIPPRVDRYREISEQIRRIFFEYSDTVQMLSLDEAWIDVTQNKTRHSYATKIGAEIRRIILQQTGLTCSVGVSFNKVIAKLCSEEKKPNGFFCVPPEKSHEFLMGINVRRIPGIGKVTRQKMESLNIHTGKDLYKRSLSDLKNWFGKSGEYYYCVIRGIYDSPVHQYREDKSISGEMTFPKNLFWGKTMKIHFEKLLAKVWAKIERKKIGGKTLVIKIKFSNFRQITRSQAVPFRYIDYGTFRNDALHKLETTLLRHFPENSVRLIGVGISGLISRKELQRKGEQLTLFPEV